MEKTYTIPVPIGTVVKDTATDEVLADLSEPGQVALILKGGRGGKGNSHFATSTRQAPRFGAGWRTGRRKRPYFRTKTTC